MDEQSIELLNGSAFFDADFYRERYPDIAAAGVDPVLHYLTFGAREGRDPSPLFSTQRYCRAYEEVVASGLNPLVHFLRIGLPRGYDGLGCGTSAEVTHQSTQTDLPQSTADTDLRSPAGPDPAREDHELVSRSDWFDRDFYLKHLPEPLPDGIEPIAHYLERGAAQGLDPSASFSTEGYLQLNADVAASGLNPLVHYLRFGRAEARTAPRSVHSPASFDEAYGSRWACLTPLAIYPTPMMTRRVTVVTDTVAPSSLFGGVGTAIILGVLLANRIGATFRLVTRSDPPDARVLQVLLASNRITLDGSFETAHAPLDRSVSIASGEGDIFISTSWWTTDALKRTVDTDRVFYLLQEDERMFYPFGDERLLCAELLDDPDVRCVVNSELLYHHLTAGPMSCRDMAARSVFFEPAFPAACRDWTDRRQGQRLKLFFYARPNHPRNLFWRGGRVLSTAIEQGILNPDEWETWWVGRDIPPVSLPFGVPVNIAQGLNWRDYQNLVSTMDAALILMDTPHPSYPPMDLAAAGAAVLTNAHPGKADLSNFSTNILMSSLSMADLLQGMRRLVILAQDDAARRSNHAEDNISRDWNASLATVLDWIAGRLPPWAH